MNKEKLKELVEFQEKIEYLEELRRSFECSIENIVNCINGDKIFKNKDKALIDLKKIMKENYKTDIEEMKEKFNNMEITKKEE